MTDVDVAVVSSAPADEMVAQLDGADERQVVSIPSTPDDSAGLVAVDQYLELGRIEDVAEGYNPARVVLRRSDLQSAGVPYPADVAAVAVAVASFDGVFWYILALAIHLRPVQRRRRQRLAGNGTDQGARAG